ncbi:MAG: hypothetical protein ACTS2F_04070 [Thainema sp.]
MLSASLLRIGNIASAGFRLYGAHWKTYLSLSAQAYLWLLVPIYGWAKYFAHAALISRLAYQELIYQPESLSTARRYINQRLWSFLGLALLVGLILLAAYIAFAIAATIVMFLFIFSISFILAAFGNEQTVGLIIGILAGVLIIAGFLFGFVWLLSRLFLPELPLALEDQISADKSISRSWQLTAGSVLRVQGLVIVAFIMTLPILMLTNYIPSIFLTQIEQNTPTYWSIYSLSLILSIGGSILVMPFWQSLKAVLYYDLRSRREGFDLNLKAR